MTAVLGPTLLKKKHFAMTPSSIETVETDRELAETDVLYFFFLDSNTSDRSDSSIGIIPQCLSSSSHHHFIEKIIEKK